MSHRYKSSWGHRIVRIDEPEPESNRPTFLFDIGLELTLKVPRSSCHKKKDIIRTALTVIVAKVMSLNRDWSQVGVGQLLLNRLRKYIDPDENDWRFEIRANGAEYFKLDDGVRLARHCAPLRGTRSYPDLPMYEEVDFYGTIGNEIEFSYSVQLFLSSAIFGAINVYNSRGFERTSPWYENDDDEMNLESALDIFQQNREPTDTEDHESAWDGVIYPLEGLNDDSDDDRY